MGQGEYFGSLECSSPEWRDGGRSDCRVLSVTTESPCELMRVSASEYVRMRERIATQDRMAKRSLIQACPGYEDWPALPIAHLAGLLHWKTIPPQHSAYICILKTSHGNGAVVCATHFRPDALHLFYPRPSLQAVMSGIRICVEPSHPPPPNTTQH
uniref:Cyclic nucleotide-binding domain-containing protein 1 n=1 Tax=Petromyzon marinus TaxID=7757 RepID=A0AAJ7T919_PETMA|nr:cyclic nucleotide-binding domain-containing protein 1 [Petromyzon marinus]